MMADINARKTTMAKILDVVQSLCAVTTGVVLSFDSIIIKVINTTAKINAKINNDVAIQ
jgi:hypothetical protein